MSLIRHQDGYESRLRALPGQVSDAQEEANAGSIERRLEAVGHSVATFLGPVVILDFLLGASVILAAEAYVSGLPTGILTALAMVVIGVCRRATLRVSGGGLMALAFLALAVFLAVESHHNHMPWAQRLTKFVILFLAAVMLACGRINVRSFVLGAMVGLCLNTVLFYAGLTSNYYPPYLTGFYGDKNVAGLYYAAFGILGLLVVPRMMEVPWAMFSLVLVFLTGSRTAVGAFLLALAWIVLRNRIGVMFRLVLTAVGWFVLQYAVTNFADDTAFGNRKGDDWYRAQVEAAMSVKASLTPWYGMGLNQGYVILGGVRREWFHNSYLQAFVEGGWLFVGATILAFAVLGMGLLDRKTVISGALLRAEAAIIVVMVCALKLGEVFMTLAGFTVLGIAIAYRFGNEATDSDLAWVLQDRATSDALPQRGADAARENEVRSKVTR